MICRLILSTALVLTIATVTPRTFDIAAEAATVQEYMADTGIITLGSKQKLRITIAPEPGTPPTGVVTFRIDTTTFGRVRCRDGSCVHPVETQTTSDLITLSPGQAASSDTNGYDYAQFRARFGPSLPAVQVNLMIVDIPTGETVSVISGIQIAAADND